MRIASFPGILLITLATACGSGEPAQSAAQVASAAAVPAAELKAEAEGQAVTQFYERREWQAAWNDAAERQLREALANRAAHGLDRVGFLDLASGASPARREARLTAAALGYASALADGHADPNELHEIYTVPRPNSDLVAGLYQALEDGRLREWLDGLAPQGAAYRAISEAYRNWSKAAAEGSSVSISEGGLIRAGDSDPRVPQIAAALARTGYLDASLSAAEANRYTEAMADAVRSFQEDFGIAVDGVIGPNTIEALNTGPGDKARAAAVALERRRWLVRNPPATRVDVNIADATLEYVRDGNVVDRRKVIVGTPDNPTPQLRSAMYRLVANPTWTVPKSIEENELAGLSPAELRSRNMVRRDGWIVQQSGPDNALGLVKFDMTNDYAIYLHDTPSKPLFERNKRQFSHGCVRVENALAFAEMIASDQGITGKWQEARQQGDQTFVPLPSQIPVRLLYHPTHVSPAGEVVVQQDVYDWNKPVAQKLGFSAGRSEKFQPDVRDFGP
jgi:L,D-transpeptidase YcbB